MYIYIHIYIYTTVSQDLILMEIIPTCLPLQPWNNFTVIITN